MKMPNKFLLILGLLFFCSACSSPVEIARRDKLEQRLQVAVSEKRKLQSKQAYLETRLNDISQELQRMRQAQDEDWTRRIQAQEEARTRGW